ncbi:hypothetical protein SERLA73DRAFT_155417 [Serpula lacrymans var. lacrymans S7.3]|uniref:Uncharacterized protein n=2 Tax=Serpula lacrymans var. lacrymans TaxID=341189 RepID=F8QA33_SERL3|nr:uncharacterized protein SERLADRAFT_411075 [Serpula lacrymans var. lacrymans S7.9]EGN94623.1 hypothetical protein SERLA73DRAFT_155417 [Serpula lacrymans var. lacrymans S7.3]EGO20103.1 hypothetical protein SERLADRAFT_411075 [Serpula lacrymans var. lacrymans S7.9]
MCQYGKHCWRCMEDGPYLQVLDGLEIISYRNNVKTKVLSVDGEILETLWAPLNNITSSTRGMTAAHRREILDDHMGDSNQKKIIRMGADPLDIATCTSYESKVQNVRADNVKTLDLYDVIEKKPITRVEIQLQLTEKENKGNSAKGVAYWLLACLEIQEAQWLINLRLQLQLCVKKLGKFLSVTDKLDVEERRQQLSLRVEAFQKGVEKHMGSLNGDTHVSQLLILEDDNPSLGDEFEDIDLNTFSTKPSSKENSLVELTTLTPPSDLR